MIQAIISDIHSNLPALRAALDHIDSQQDVSEIHCLGDIVGYGAEPKPCIDLVRERCTSVVIGNHDQAVATGEGIEYLPRDGQDAARHNTDVLSDEDLTWLGRLPLRHAQESCTFVHASPMNPDQWLRIESFQLAQMQFDHFDTDVCFLGHTHMPAVLSNTLGVLRVRPGHRFMVNVGSVGQPRDGDPRACVAFFDTESFEYRLDRVAYNVDRAASQIRKAGLPSRLAERLERGM